MVEHVEIRRANPEDAAAIALVLYESFAEYKDLYTDGGFAATALDPERVLNRMLEGPMWTAWREGAVVGTVAAVGKDRSVYIRGMAVLPAARGLGVGTALLREVEGWALRENSAVYFSALRLFCIPRFVYMSSSAFDGKIRNFGIFLAPRFLPWRRPCLRPRSL